MKFHVICLRDIKGNQHEAPMFVNNIQVAIRDISDMINDPEKRFNWQKHPEDFELWHLGLWDNESAEFTSDDDETDIHKATYRQLLALSTLKTN